MLKKGEKYHLDYKNKYPRSHVPKEITLNGFARMMERRRILKNTTMKIISEVREVKKKPNLSKVLE